MAVILINLRRVNSPHEPAFRMVKAKLSFQTLEVTSRPPAMILIHRQVSKESSFKGKRWAQRANMQFFTTGFILDAHNREEPS